MGTSEEATSASRGICLIVELVNPLILSGEDGQQLTMKVDAKPNDLEVPYTPDVCLQLPDALASMELEALFQCDMTTGWSGNPLGLGSDSRSSHAQQDSGQQR